MPFNSLATSTETSLFQIDPFPLRRPDFTQWNGLLCSYFPSEISSCKLTDYVSSFFNTSTNFSLKQKPFLNGLIDLSFQNVTRTVYPAFEHFPEGGAAAADAAAAAPAQIIPRDQLMAQLEQWIGESANPAEFHNRGHAKELIIAVYDAREEAIDFHGIQLGSFPPICGLTFLTHVNLEGTGLNSLPEEFVNLENLKRLSLEGNHFSEFPPQLLTLQLTELVLANNQQLVVIPADILSMGSLSILSLGGTQVQENDLPWAEGEGPELFFNP